MNLLLVFLLGMVVLGVCTDRMSARTYTMIGGAAFLVAALYFAFERLMT